VIVMEPLRGGTLAAPPPPAIDALWRESEMRRTPAEWALRWVWNHPEVTVVLSGMSDEAQVDENLRIAPSALPGALTDAEVNLVTAVGVKYRQIMKVGCTGCGYCLPCPNGVNIPGCFDSFNALHTFGKTPQEAGFQYVLSVSGIFSRSLAYASLCSQCLDCLDKCPQKLQIPDLLEQVVREFEGDSLKDIEAMARRVFNA